MNRPARPLLPLVLAALLGLLAASPLQAAETARVRVILVEATNNAGSGEAVDPALRAYAATLQRLFRFASYTQVSRSSIRMQVPGDGSAGLPGGQSLSLRADGNDGSGLLAELTWSRGSQRLLHTRIQLRPGSPAVLGGPRSGRDGGNYLLILELD